MGMGSCYNVCPHSMAIILFPDSDICHGFLWSISPTNASVNLCASFPERFLHGKDADNGLVLLLVAKSTRSIMGARVDAM